MSKYSFFMPHISAAFQFIRGVRLLKVDLELRHLTDGCAKLRIYVTVCIVSKWCFIVFSSRISFRALHNPIERDYLIELCKSILRETKLHPQCIGVITPYRQQLNSIKNHLMKEKLNGISVNTIDEYQGQEKDIIVFSCVRGPNQKKTIGFLSHPQRMNVALTRAKKTLIILANCDSIEVFTFLCFFVNIFL